MKKLFIVLILTAVGLCCGQAAGAPGAKILNLSGEVKIRRGVEENWQPARMGMVLQDVDAILTGETGRVTLLIRDGVKFKLGRNAILDIADLRKITRKELFLYLTAQKVQKIAPRRQRARLRVGNVSAVHGIRKGVEASGSSPANVRLWLLAMNGARALFSQKFYPNTILKLHRIREQFPRVIDCGESQFYLARAYQALQMTGQALDAYQAVVQEVEAWPCSDSEAQSRKKRAQSAAARLKSGRDIQPIEKR